MIFQYPIQVNPVKDDARSEANGDQLRTEVGFEGFAFDAEILQGLLAVVATLFHVIHRQPPCGKISPLLFVVRLAVPLPGRDCSESY